GTTGRVASPRRLRFGPSERRVRRRFGNPDDAVAKGEQLAIGTVKRRRLKATGPPPAALPAQAIAQKVRRSLPLQLIIEGATAEDVFHDARDQHWGHLYHHRL